MQIFCSLGIESETSRKASTPTSTGSKSYMHKWTCFSGTEITNIHNVQPDENPHAIQSRHQRQSSTNLRAAATDPWTFIFYRYELTLTGTRWLLVSYSNNQFSYHSVFTRIFYTTIIFLMLLYACETWSLTLREEHKLMVFGNTVLRIFGAKRNEVTGGVDKMAQQGAS
jgi:hypothetical protein